MISDLEDRYWFNTKTGEVEHGLLSPSKDRIGPFNTADAASHALEKIQENSAIWAAEDALDN
ncbi:MAG: hypothetical protein B5766_06590 [Candidatus Lumbricidophila eiseniae]|uniref:Methionine aminopeptidase n=1 Tax=Candidatus Lumbricidiphila eiseniae TaxID=1969409 RepID=A0A2A6FRG5_9MICO|nr:MAG: hypothetical protein B5766_06590 [Candidatus Lumbricidophila eiseniae]